MARPKSDIAPRILVAARARFLSEGVDGASLRRIARDAHTSIGMVYYYFPTKDDLFFAVVEEVYERILADLARALEPDVPARARIRRMIGRIGSLSDEETAVIRLILREALTSSARLERLIDRFLRGHIPLVLETVSEGVRDGTLRGDCHPVVLMMATFALGGPPQLIRRAVGHRPIAEGVPAGEDLADLLVSILFEGIGNKAPDPEVNGRT